MPRRARRYLPFGMYGPFDTLEAAETPARAGLPGPRAKAIAMRKAAGENVATGADIAVAKAELKAELAAVKWVLVFMAGLLLAIAAHVYGVV